MNKTCIVIPVYNHSGAILKTIQDLQSSGLTIVLIDDGSSDNLKELLETAELPQKIHKFFRTKNGGKGSALLDGFKHAIDLGFTHGITVDADGQHSAEDIQKFIKAIELYPERLIMGAPLFDRDAPLVRRLGREISNVLAWLQSLSIAPRDVLCGYRAYPLKFSCELIDTSVGSRRMDFDPEFVVKAIWQGMKVINIKTFVRYPLDGVSHFNYFSDNKRIAKMHIKLIAGMIIRSPYLVLQHIKNSSFSQLYFSAL